MTEINWNIFETKFNGKQQSAFERMAYALFCSRFDQNHGIFSFKNQTGIESEPININDKMIGFQAKYLEPTVSFSSKKDTFIKALEKTKQKNPDINEVYFYVNKPIPESKSKNKKKPNYLLDIEKKANELHLSIVWQVPSQIEYQLSSPKNHLLTKEFFPDLIETKFLLEKDHLLDISRTAIIQIDIAKIKSEFTRDWGKMEQILDKLYIYADFTNEIIASEIFNILNHRISSTTRSGMPSNIACSIDGLVLTYFPSSYGDTERELRIENGKSCIYIGFNLVYDAFIYTNNFEVAQWGLNIWKFVYRESKRNNYTDLVDLVLEQYKELESTLDRPERDDLGNAKEILQIFKEDLDTYSLAFPPLPEHLYQLTLKD